MDGAEAGGGEGDEQSRVGGDGCRDALAAGQPGADQLVFVGPVDLGAGRAAGRPPVPARLEQQPARLLGFLDTYAATAPRVLLRYAIEHLDPEQRAHYLNLKPRGGRALS